MAYTILIIDDEPMLTDLLSEHLTHHGYRTHTANNSAQALELGRGLQVEWVTYVSHEKDPQESKGCFSEDLVVVSAGRRLCCIQQASGQLHLE